MFKIPKRPAKFVAIATVSCGLTVSLGAVVVEGAGDGSPAALSAGRGAAAKPAGSGTKLVVGKNRTTTESADRCDVYRTRMTRFQACRTHNRPLATVDAAARPPKPTGGGMLEVREEVRLNPFKRTWQHRFRVRLKPGAWGLILSSTQISINPGCGAGCTAAPAIVPLSPVKLAAKKYTVTLSSPSSQTITHAVRPIITINARTINPTPIEFGLGRDIRCDSAALMGGTQGCAHPAFTPTFTLRERGKPAEVAKHIRAAQAKLSTPYGVKDRGYPLHRAISKATKKANRGISCPSSRHKKKQTDLYGRAWAKGLSCDEYPFAATQEGSSTSFSWAWVSPRSNSSAGGLELGFFKRNRVIDGDAFWVSVP